MAKIAALASLNILTDADLLTGDDSFSSYWKCIL